MNDYYQIYFVDKYCRSNINTLRVSADSEQSARKIAQNKIGHDNVIINVEQE